ncbi:MAG: hypothetical protein AAGE52_18995 [Myxococcota bacterium]
MRRAWQWSVLLAVPFLGPACEAGDLTQIVVFVETDFAPGELAAVAFSVRSTGEAQTTTADLTGDGAPEFPLSLTVVPGGADDAPLEVAVTGLGPDGALLARQTRTTRFVPGTSLSLRVDLSRLCTALSCEAGETCVVDGQSGRCALAAIPPDNLPPFVAGQAVVGNELCNGRDDDGDGVNDNGFDFDRDTQHCGGCFAACPVPETGSGTASCNDRVCGLDCSDLQADCNGDPLDGCETSLLDAANCGSCGEVCPDTAPVCRREGEEPVCATGCLDGETLCGGSCQDLMTSVDACGSCEPCPSDFLGTPQCIEGVCIPECGDSFHRCGDRCESNDAVATCGQRCEDPCPSGRDGAICIRETCGLACPDGRFDCDGDPTNGCEVRRSGGGATLEREPNCGGCGVQCGASVCEATGCSVSVLNFELGPRHGCAFLSNGQVWCWGPNESGQVRSPATDSPLTPVLVDLGPVAGGVAVNVGPMDDATSYITFSTSMFISTQQAVFLGRNAFDGTTATVPDRIGVAGFSMDVSDGAGFAIDTFTRRLLAFGDRSLGIFEPFDPDALGANNRLPRSTVLATETLITSLGALREFRLARHGRTTCSNMLASGLQTDLQCWGTPADDEPIYVGNAVNTGAATPTPINPAGTTFRFDTGFDVDLGPLGGCANFATDESTRPYCWGDWGCGVDSLAPEPLSGALVDGSTGLSVGRSTACAIQGDRSLVCWGVDLVDGRCRERPEVSRGEFASVRKVQVSEDFACALLGGSIGDSLLGAPGTLWCWGNNAHGQLGSGPAEDLSFGPRQVVFGSLD